MLEIEPDDVSASARRPRPGRVKGSDFLPLSPGHVWVLRNENDTDRVTTVDVDVIEGALALRFSKNHPDTYHGADGTDNNLVWFISQDRGWIYPSNSNSASSSDVGDAFPDDIRIDRATGREVVRIWLTTTDRATPVCFLLPSGSFFVPAERQGTFSYLARWADGTESWASGGLWRVRWDLVEPDLMRIRFDETYTDHPAAIYEDWYLRRSEGLVAIRQWYDAGRTQFRRGVASEELAK